VKLYESQEMNEKRRLIDFVCSNSVWKDGRLIPNYRKPFDLLSVTNEAYQKKKAAFTSKDSLFDIWLPIGHDLRTIVPVISVGYEPVNRKKLSIRKSKALNRPKKHIIHKALSWKKMLDEGCISGKHACRNFFIFLTANDPLSNTVYTDKSRKFFRAQCRRW
jgi:hypothetical protein